VIKLSKKCWRCPPEKSEQPLENFCRGGKDSVCKACRYQLNSEWAKTNRDKLRPKRAQYMKDYRAAKKREKEALAAKSSEENKPPEPGSSN